MLNELTSELGRRKPAVWKAYRSIEDAVKRIKNIWLCAHLLNITALTALSYSSETWALRKQEEKALNVAESAIERVMVRASRFTRMKDGIRSSLLCWRSNIRHAAAFANESKA
ncbi:hypothetical protein RB195_001998 [Necator americanus]|uniref:Uncharacterized protein n=1 Tax=Necator americanus TaxID=51031 RepID=A0ABR1DH81_NECAM